MPHLVCQRCKFEFQVHPRPDICPKCGGWFPNHVGLNPLIDAMGQTRSFTRLYLHARGEGETPQQWDYWSCLSLLAALVGDNLYMNLNGMRVVPNLYVMLVGSSGKGKGHAISGVFDLLDASGVVLNKHRGPITYKAVVDKLAMPRVDENGTELLPDSKLWLIFDEFANAVESGTMADRFVKMMTELYTGYYEFTEGTRMHSFKTVDKAVVSWLCGTTAEWLLDVLNVRAVFSGFTARCVVSFFKEVEGALRYFRIKFPGDREQVMAYLTTVVRCVPYYHGEVTLTQAASDLSENWYGKRMEPVDRALMPFFNREQVLSYKIAMLLAVSDGTPNKVNRNQIWEAQRLVGIARKNMAELARFSCTTPTIISGGNVEREIRRKGIVKHSPLVRIVAGRYGIDGPKLKEIVQDLYEDGVIGRGKSKTGGVIYTWKGRR